MLASASRRVVAVVGGRGVSVRTLATTQTSPEVLYVIDYVVLALRMARHSPVRRHLWTLALFGLHFFPGTDFVGVCVCVGPTRLADSPPSFCSARGFKARYYAACG